MRNTIFLIVCVVTLWGTPVSAQRDEFRIAIQVAEDHRIKGEFVKACRILVDLEPIGPASSLERAYRSDGEYTNEYYLKDEALHRLMHSFLADQQSDVARITAHHIANRFLRNQVLSEVLAPQTRAAARRPEEFDMMMAKAEKTAAAIVDSPQAKINERYADRAYETIAGYYISFGRYDRAMTALRKIKDVEHFGQGVVYSVQSSIASHRVERTLENEKMLRTLADTIRSQVMKAEMLCAFADFYDYSPEAARGPATVDDAVCKKKRLALMREAADLIQPLAGDPQKMNLMLRIYQCHVADGRKMDSQIVRDLILKDLLAIKSDQTLYNQYCSLCYSFYPVNPYQPDQPTELDLKLYERAYRHSLVMNHESMIGLMQVVWQWTPPGSQVRTELLDNAFQRASALNSPARLGFLLSLVNFVESDKKEALLDEVAELVLKIGRDTVAHPRFETTFYRMQSVLQSYDLDRMLELVHSPRMPEGWKQPIYYFAARNMLERDNWNSDRDSESPAFRVQDFYQLYNLIDTSGEKCDLLYAVGRSQTRFIWPQPMEEVLATPDPATRAALCRLLIVMNGDLKTDVDVMPLLEALEQHAESQTEAWDKLSWHRSVFQLAYRYSLWDEKEMIDRLKQFESAVAEQPGVIRFDNLSSMLFSELNAIFSAIRDAPWDDAAKNFQIDTLLAATQKIPEQNYYRLTAYLASIRLAVSYEMRDRACEVAEEALAYSERIPSRVRRLGYTGEEYRDIKLLYETICNGHAETTPP